jgi:hypothetical protein
MEGRQEEALAAWQRSWKVYQDKAGMYNFSEEQEEFYRQAELAMRQSILEVIENW